MKRSVLVIFFIIGTIDIASSQNFDIEIDTCFNRGNIIYSAAFYDVKVGDSCFIKGNYSRALSNYQKQLESSNNMDIEIRIMRAKSCIESLNQANLMFSQRNYAAAKKSFLEILDSNPCDEYALLKSAECEKLLNPPILNISQSEVTFDFNGGTKTISIYTNIPSCKISESPDWCTAIVGSQIIFRCNSNPNNTERRCKFIVTADNLSKTINIIQYGVKPSTPQKVETLLTVSNSNLSFDAIGGTKRIYVTTNYKMFTVQLLPSWCTVIHDYKNNCFDITVKKNLSVNARSDWFTVKADDKLVKIYINQSGSQELKPKVELKENRCFNCPGHPKHTFGWTFGYVNKPIYFIDYDNNSFFASFRMQGVSTGIKVEPLFKYGFAINTGLFYEYYLPELNNKNYRQALNLPVALEYRLNFSDKFSVFFYGGASVDYIFDAQADLNGNGILHTFNYKDYLDKNRFAKFLEYGGGVRIDIVEFSFGLNRFIDVNNNFLIYNQQNKVITFSVMF